jgi:hypothetical protein
MIAENDTSAFTFGLNLNADVSLTAIMKPAATTTTTGGHHHRRPPPPAATTGRRHRERRATVGTKASRRLALANRWFLLTQRHHDHES